MWHFYIPIAKYQKEKVKQSQLLSHFKKSSIHETGHPKLVHWDDQRDGIGKEVGGGFRMGDTRTPVADSCLCMAKTTTIL